MPDPLRGTFAGRAAGGKGGDQQQCIRSSEANRSQKKDRLIDGLVWNCHVALTGYSSVGSIETGDQEFVRPAAFFKEELHPDRRLERHMRLAKFELLKAEKAALADQRNYRINTHFLQSASVQRLSRTGVNRVCRQA
jgi:hypothetical protein